MSPSRRPPREKRPRPAVPDATVARLPLYLRVLTALADDGVETVSSDTLAAAAGVTSAKVRKDLSYLGSYGTRGVGYDVGVLLDRISARLGLTEDRGVMLVGVGNLGHALARYGGFPARGFRIVALVDADPARAGEFVGGVEIRPVDELERLIEDYQVTIGVICTPAGAAQQVCGRLVAAGVTSILNFAPVVLSVPDGVDVRKVDLAVELQILSFHEARKRPDRTDGPRVRPVASGTLPLEGATGALPPSEMAGPRPEPRAPEPAERTLEIAPGGRGDAEPAPTPAAGTEAVMRLATGSEGS